MSSSTHAQPEHQGASPPGAAPQVVVRAGKTYVCSACGTLVEIPAEFVGQFVLAAADSPKDTPAKTPTKVRPNSKPTAAPAVPPATAQCEPEACETAGNEIAPRSTPQAEAVQRETPHSETPGPITASGPRTSRPTFELQEPPELSSNKPPRRPSTSRRPQRRTFAGQTIDGLTVPSARQLDQAFHWVEFRLGVLGQQDGEIRRLKKLLRQQQGTKVRPNPPRRVPKTRPPKPVQCDRQREERRAPVDLRAMPEGNRETERGPP